MAQPEVDAWFAGLVAALFAASLIAWATMLRRMQRGPVLPFAPRRPVPWGGLGTFLALFFVAVAITTTLFGLKPKLPEEITSPIESIQQIFAGSMQQAVFTGIFLAAVIVISQAKLADLGLPEYLGELPRDVRIGFLAWLAALAPVYGLQALLVFSFGEPPGHPLIRMIQREPNPVLFTLALVAAVIVAPICEEIAFRLLLQGWLEKWEDEQLGWRSPPSIGPASDLPGEELAPVESPTIPPPEPPQRGVGGLPYGWMPILGSALLFALAHFGIGMDPIPLFILALVLGYIYNRTHRIVPSIVTHALFNLLSLLALWFASKQMAGQ